MFLLNSKSKTGETFSPQELHRQKCKQLRDIHFAVRSRDVSMWGPRSGQALVKAVFVLMSSQLILFYYLQDSSLYQPEPLRDFWHWFPAVASVGTFLLAWLRSDLPRDWSTLLDTLLAGYSPVNADAYKSLQRRTQDLNELRGYLILEWLGQERESLDLSHTVAPTSKFWNKKL